MPYFTPPTVERAAEAAQSSRLFCRLKIPVGQSVLKSASGSYATVQNPADEDVSAAAIAYLGGRTYEISDEEAADLTAAGYEVTE